MKVLNWLPIFRIENKHGMTFNLLEVYTKLKEYQHTNNAKDMFTWVSGGSMRVNVGYFALLNIFASAQLYVIMALFLEPAIIASVLQSGPSGPKKAAVSLQIISSRA